MPTSHDNRSTNGAGDCAPQRALARLEAGHARFRAGQRADHPLLEQVAATAGGQAPFAIVLSCIDSRVAPELVFDLGIGEIFSVRVAGNVLTDEVLGSMEFACALAGSALIVVLGHTACGAIRGAVEGVELGHLTGLLAKIKPVVHALDGSNMTTDERITQVSRDNVAQVIEQIQARSEVLSGLIATGELGLIGGMYSVSEGAVRFGDLICLAPDSTQGTNTL